MRKPIYSSQFKRDLKKLKRSGRDMALFREVAALLLREERLPIKYRDHPLRPPFQGHRDCHIRNDWVLIYKRTEDAIIFERTGTHSDIFD